MRYNHVAFKLDPLHVRQMVSAEEFRRDYLVPQKPLVIKELSRQWPAYNKWNYDFFKSKAGDIQVPLYNNEPSTPKQKVNHADLYLQFSEYLDMLSSQPTQLRMFLFNIFKHIPELCDDFSYPDELMNGFLKKFPMMFFGGKGSVVHLHYDMDLSDIFLTQFYGKKRILLFPPSESLKLYRMPWMVQSFVDLNNPNLEKYPRLKEVRGYECELEHGDTLYMPGGYWHYMEYTEGGFALALRAFPEKLSKRASSIHNLFIMRNIDNLCKKMFGKKWYDYKVIQAQRRAISSI